MAQSTFKIYKSSAGSGKTFTLVKEYLGIALRNPERYRNILALTFTNKAAGEMKERILSELASLASGVDSPMRQVLVEEFELNAADIPESAQAVLGNILHDYANFAVRTIDSFTHKLIRSFAKDLELPGRFEIEMDTKVILQRTVDQLMDSIGRDDYVTEILVRFVEEKLRDRSGWRIEADLKEVGQELFKENSKPFLNAIRDFDHALFPEFIAMLRGKKRAFPEQMQELAKAAMEIMQRYGLTAKDFSGSSNSVMGKVEKLCQAMKPSEINALVNAKVFKDAAEEDKWLNKGQQNAQVDAALAGGLRDKVVEIWDYFQTEYDTYLTAWHAFQNVHSLAVMQQIEELIESYKVQYNLVHISDFQPKIEQFMREEAPEYIYWRLGERYQHYMLDEFQDTSLLQWLNLRPLIENLRSGGAGRDGSLLIVGDSKQAIYRWRGGETSLMELMVPHDLGVEPLVLDRNFRSKEYVVDFNNRFFEEAVALVATEQPEVGLIYEGVAQLVRAGNETQGFVRIELVNIDEATFAELAYDRAVELVQSLLVQGYQLRDIAILVRTKGEGADMAEALSKAGIRVISAESILLCKSPVVNFLVSLIKFLFDPGDGISRAEVLHYFFHYLHRGTEWGIDPNQKIRELLQDEHPVTAMLEVLPREFARLTYRTDRLSLYELAEETVRIFGLQDVAPAFVQHFLDVVLDFSERKKPDLGAFLEYWEEKKAGFSLIVPDGENAVEIMTIHKSKGLEFPVVIIPRADWSITPKTGSTIWAESGDLFGDYPSAHLIKPQAGIEESAFGETYEEEVKKTMLDNMNLLYVAFTRPRERLYVLAPDKSKTAKKAKVAEEMKNVGALIRRVLETEGFQGMDSTIYETGFPFPPASHTADGPQSPAPRLISAPWRDRIRIDRKFRKFWETSEDENGLQTGPILAQVFRTITDADGLGLVLDRMEETGLLPATQRNEIALTASEILARPELKEAYTPGMKVRLGMKFLLEGAEPLTIDRVILLPHKTILLTILDSSREKVDRKALQSCLQFLQEEEKITIETIVLKLSEGNVEKMEKK
jgi:ATP-dependent exoDNAse (exonuclease V) beta subunit